MKGLAFLTKYRKYSPRDVLSREEIEYNYARSFHGLGELESPLDLSSDAHS
jgi:general transcription factor 3C polypeptide 3 (transcription factor C subunit 4)